MKSQWSKLNNYQYNQDVVFSTQMYPGKQNYYLVHETSDLMLVESFYGNISRSLGVNYDNDVAKLITVYATKVINEPITPSEVSYISIGGNARHSFEDFVNFFYSSISRDIGIINYDYNIAQITANYGGQSFAHNDLYINRYEPDLQVILEGDVQSKGTLENDTEKVNVITQEESIKKILISILTSCKEDNLIFHDYDYDPDGSGLLSISGNTDNVVAIEAY